MIASRRTIIALAGFAPRGVRSLLRGRLRLRRICHRLEADIVFLVGPLDLGSEGFRDPLGDFELGRGVHDPDRADVALVDAATTANHRQQPARFCILSASDVGPEPNAGLHAVTRRGFARLRSRPGRAIIATRAARVVARRAIVARRPDIVTATMVTGTARRLARPEQ